MQAFEQKKSTFPHFFIKKVILPNNYPQFSCQKVVENNHSHILQNTQKPYYT